MDLDSGKFFEARRPNGGALKVAPAHLCRSLVLAWDLAIRDLQSRYARSLMGVGWFLLTPVLLICVYWMLFGYFLHLSWKDPDTDASVGYIVPFASALLVYLLLTDVVNSSLLLFVSKRNYVQKSPFPIWILWLANLIRAGAHGAVNLAIVLVLSLYSELLSLAGLLWLLPALALIICFCAGLSLVLAVLGPFLSDLSEAARVVMRVLFYAAPVTYPLSIVPERFLWIVEANPMTQLIDPLRRAISFGLSPSILSYTAMAIVSALLCGAGAWMYARLKGAIADVV